MTTQRRAQGRQARMHRRIGEARACLDASVNLGEEAAIELAGRRVKGEQVIARAHAQDTLLVVHDRHARDAVLDEGMHGVKHGRLRLER